MSETQDHYEDFDPKEIAAHPAIQDLLAQLQEMTGCTNLFILGAGTPEQEAEYAERSAREDREQREKWEKEHSLGAGGLVALFCAMEGKPQMLQEIVRNKVSGTMEED